MSSNKILRKDQICKECGKVGCLAKGLCSSCYNRAWQLKPKVKKVKKVKPRAESGVMDLPKGVVEIDGFLYFDHDIEFSEDAKERAVQYRACGIQRSTVIRLIVFQSDLTVNQVKWWLRDFGVFYTFRKTGGAKERDVWYKGQEVAQMSRVEPDNGYKPGREYNIVSPNQPLINKRERRNKGHTKAEKRLLKDIKNGTDYWYKDNFLSGDNLVPQ